MATYIFSAFHLFSDMQESGASPDPSRTKVIDLMLLTLPLSSSCDAEIADTIRTSRTAQGNW